MKREADAVGTARTATAVRAIASETTPLRNRSVLGGVEPPQPFVEGDLGLPPE